MIRYPQQSPIYAAGDRTGASGRHRRIGRLRYSGVSMIFRSHQARLVAYVSAAHGLVHAVELTYPALLSYIEAEFGSDLLILGVIATVFAFAFGLSALPSGALVDRLGSRRVLVALFVASAGIAVLVAVSPNPVWLAVSLSALGLAVGLYHPAGISLIARGVEQRALAFGYHGIFGNLGMAIAPAIAVGMAAWLGWRSAYVLLAALAAAVALFLLVVPVPQQADLPPDEERVPQAARPSRSPVSAALVLIYCVWVLNGFVYRGTITFLPKHIEDHLGVDLFGISAGAWAGSLTTAALLAGCAGQYLGGWLTLRHPLERLAPILTGASVLPLLLVGMLGGPGLVAMAAAFIFFNFAAQPIYTALLAEYSPQQALGRSYGLSFFASFGLGSTAATFAGFFADRWGTGAAFIVLAPVAALALVLAAALWRLWQRPAPLVGPAVTGTAGG